MRERELKLFGSSVVLSKIESLPMRERELKLYRTAIRLDL